jgi:hypothetical protein
MLLTVDELRTFVTTSLSDDALLTLLDAAEADLGSLDAVTERHDGGYEALVLDRRVGTVTSVREMVETASPTTLDATDYRADGYILHRLSTGTHPSTAWLGEVEVVHTPTDDEAERKRAQAELVRIDLSVAGGVVSERIGDYSVGYATKADAASARAAIVARFQGAMVR